MLRFLVLCVALLIGSSSFSQNGQLDTDGDGVVDVQDVDDDNDGIFDVDENVRDSQSINDWINRVNVNAANGSIIYNNGLLGWSNGTSSIPFSDMGFEMDYTVSFEIKQSKRMALGMGLTDESQDISDIENGFYFENSNFQVIQNGIIQPEVYPFNLEDQFSIAYNADTIYFYYLDNLMDEMTTEANLDFALDTSFFGQQGNEKCHVKNITISYSFADLDLDNDGDINSIDLDSDGDGCFDVVEAGFMTEDDDGILGTGIPVVDSQGKVISAQGYGCEAGETNCIELNFNFLNPSFNVCALSNYGVSIDTQSLPNSIYDITYNDLELTSLISGNEDSENRIETLEDVLNEIFISVRQTNDKALLSLKILQQIDETLEVFVNYQGLWKPFSTKFHEIIDDKIIFKPDHRVTKVPFSLNLIDGVYYDRLSALVLVIDEEINLENANWTLMGPNDFLQNISAIDNTFTWDGSLAPSGNYKFSLTIQDKIFVGQFLIKNN